MTKNMFGIEVDRSYSPADIAQIFCVDKQTVLKEIYAGNLPAVRISSHSIRVPGAVLDAYVAEGQIKP